jgi:hypothetical protein
MVAGLIVSGTYSCSDSTPKAAQKSNFVYIPADNIGYGDLSCYLSESTNIADDHPDVVNKCSEIMKDLPIFRSNTNVRMSKTIEL